MPRYFIQISFDGTNYHGWQLQKNAHTVQAELNQAMEIAFRQKIATLGCCRTDAGVHATELFAHFNCNTNLQSIQNIVYRMNFILPKDISVQNIFPVKIDANARFDAVSRTYKYFIHHKKNPFLVNRSYYRRIKPKVKAMNKAAQLLLKYDDFSCFSKSNAQAKSKICKIQKAQWKYVSNQLIFEIKADRFLRNMVRAIVGTLLEIGDSKKNLSDFKEILESKNRSMAGFSVPACGLFLVDVKYPKSIFTKK